ncbi:MAG: hypothetical protein ACI9KE_000861 [Polyangiales bacterium]|jgi:hypothetical protein
MPRHFSVPIILLTLSLAVSLALPEHAAAQTDRELAEARGWFTEGIGYSEAGRYEEAVAAFRRVLATIDSPPVRYNLALNLYELTLIREADEHVQSILDNRETDASVRSDAADLRLHIEEIGGRVRIDVIGVPEGLYDVEIDGQHLASRDVGRSLRVRVGAHNIEVMRNGGTVASETTNVTQGETAVVSVDLSVPDPAEAAATVVPSVIEEPPPEEGTPILKSWQFWAVTGAVVVAVAAVVVGVLVLGAPEDTSNSPTVGNFEPGLITFR